jgi:translation initiation factor IF-2
LARKVRVYELARELGLTNKEALDLCESLGIGVKSHSSSIEEAQADRVRRKADAEGLRRPVAEEAAAPSNESAGARQVAPTPSREAPKTVADRPGTPAPIREATRPAPDRQVAPAASAGARQVAPTPSREAPKTVADRPGTPAPIREATRLAPGLPDADRRDPQAGAAAVSAGAGTIKAPPPPARPLSPSGKPIPPPPARPLSPSGKPIPPPPGVRGSRAPASPSHAPGTDRPVGPRRFVTPSQLARSGGTSIDQAVLRGGGRPGGPGGPGRPGGGPPGRGRPPARGRSRRRRRSAEELEPTQLTASYTPSNAPVPEGEIIVERGTTAQVLGPKLNRSPGDVIRFLMLQGEMLTATQSLSDEMIELFAAEIGAQVKLVDPGEEQEAVLVAKYFDNDESDEGAVPRAPVVTVMGHVDHGKTTLLDRIRNTSVAASEAGGITQHIGAYQVEHAGRTITFIDTPGHEAFTAMRARGANVTDIVILVVAADDGVMPQTVEAINHARAAGVPIVVAITKIDKPEADVNRVMQQLSENGLVPEAWGGDTVTVEVAATEGLGIDDLLEHLLLVADLQELTAVPTGRARGVVLEANLDTGRGPVATVLVKRGTLSPGDVVVAGPAWGKVKALLDERGSPVKAVGPSAPAVLLGLSCVPSAGDEFRVVEDQSIARTIAETRDRRMRTLGHAPVISAGAVKLEDIFEQVSRGETATLNLIVKADVQGSLEALSDSLRKLERDEVKISFVHRAVGGITENDVALAAASGSTIIGFNVRPDRRSREAAQAQGVEIRTYEVIYKVLEDIEAALVGMLKPETEEVVTGEAEVRAVFRVPRIGAVAGCYVRNGTITRGSKVRFLRDGVIIWKGTIASLRRFKDDVREVQSGFECGIGLSDFQDLKEGDLIETFEEREIARV